MSKDEALAILKAYVMAQEPRVEDLIRGVRAPSHCASAKYTEQEGGIFLTAIAKDPRVDERAFVGFGLPEPMIEDLGDDCPRPMAIDGQLVHSPQAFVKAFALKLIRMALEDTIEARLERESLGVRAPQWQASWDSDG